MKQNKYIFMQSWLQSHARLKKTSTDQWYLDFANKLVPVIEHSTYYADSEKKIQRSAAVVLTLYLEDCIADDGGFRRFVRLYHARYGTYLPFYEISEDYIPDEINEVDIAFVLWKLSCMEKYDHTDMINPLNSDLLKLAKEVYDVMFTAFEQAPVCDIPSHDWVLNSEQLLQESTPIPEILPGVELPKDVQLFLEATGGEPLQYCALPGEAEAFMMEKLHWKKDDLPDFGEEIYHVVLWANAKGILIAPFVGQFFNDKRNSVAYDPVMESEQAYRMFIITGYCPFDLLKYGVKYGLFSNAQFPFENGKTLLWNHWDFIARWFLGEYYEGE